MERISLHNGGIVPIVFKHGMWRSDINGIHYCSQTKKDLLRCISECQNAVIPEVIPAPVIPIADLLFSDLRTGSLEQKQNARRRLLDLANAGNEDAVKYLDFLPIKNLSFAAKYWAKSIGKAFVDVSYAELVEHVNDVVLRNKLMEELASLFKIED